MGAGTAALGCTFSTRLFTSTHCCCWDERQPDLLVRTGGIRLRSHPRLVRVLFSLGYAAKWLAEVFTRPSAWQRIDAFIGVTMLCIAVFVVWPFL